MSDKDSVTFKYKFNDDYNPLYANGAYGGVSARGEIVIHFYLERTPVVRKQVNELTSDGRVGDIVEVEPGDVHNQIIRFVQTGVVLDRRVAKQLHSWLGKQLNSLEGGDGKMTTAEHSAYPSFVGSDTATEPPHILETFAVGSIMDEDLIYTEKSFMIVAFDTATGTILPQFDKCATAASINRRTVKGFAGLEPGWNGGSGEPLPEAVIQRALGLIDQLEFQDMEIFPTGRRTIQFEFDIGARSLEVEIGATGVTMLQSNEMTGEDREFELNTDREILHEIRAFYG